MGNYKFRDVLQAIKMQINGKIFSNVPEISGSEPQKGQCSLPSITYKNKKLVFDCDTRSSTCHSSITCDDVKSSDESEIRENQCNI